MKVILFSLAIFASAPTFAQKNEYRVSVGLGMLMNSKDVTGSMLKVKNTFQPSLGFDYSRINKSSIILSAGAAVGYNQYKTMIDFPFESNGFIRPGNLDKYKTSNIVHYGELNVNVGYRFKKLSKFNPEIRIGQVLRLPFDFVSDETGSDELTIGGTTEHSFYRFMNLGNSGKWVIGELYNYVYVGINHTHGKKVFTAGIKLQGQTISSENYRVYVKGFNDQHETKADENFKGTNTTISLMLGMNL